MEDLTRMRTRILQFLCLCTDEGNERFVGMWEKKALLESHFRVPVEHACELLGLLGFDEWEGGMRCKGKCCREDGGGHCQ